VTTSPSGSRGRSEDTRLDGSSMVTTMATASTTMPTNLASMNPLITRSNSA
jgi:hypothetical protein